MNNIDEYIKACEYPSILNIDEVQKNLKLYLKEIGISREVIRLERGWTPYTFPCIFENVKYILKKMFKTSARSAIDVRDTRSAIAASNARFEISARSSRSAIDVSDGYAAISARSSRSARVAISARSSRSAINACTIRDIRSAITASDAHSVISACSSSSAIIAINVFSRLIVNSYYWNNWDLSLIATTWIGNNNIIWAKYIYNAFLNGAWFLYWTDRSLFWFSKPICKIVKIGNNRVFHSENSAALISDWTDLYFLNGILLNKDIVMTPAEKLDPHVLLKEKNAEVRREIIGKIGIEKVCEKLNSKSIDKSSDMVYELLLLDLR